MFNWLKKIGLLCAGVIALGTNCWASYTLTAPGSCDCGEIGFELLILRPSIEGDQYVIVGPARPAVNSNPVGTLKDTDPDYNLGGTVFGRWYLCNGFYDVYAEYTYYDTDDKTSNTAGAGEVIWAFLPHPDVGANIEEIPQGTGIAKTELNYQEFFIDFGTRICLGPCLSTRLSFGLRYDRFRDTIRGEYFQLGASVPRDTAEYKSKLWGIGPGFGIDSRFSICNGLYLTGRFRGALLTGESSSIFTSTGITFPARSFTDVDVETTTRVFPIWDARAGLGYNFCICNYNLNTELGWMNVRAYNAISRPYFFSALSDGTGRVDTIDLDLYGVYIRASLTF